MRIYLKYIFLFLIAGSIFSSCNQKDEKVYSFWALQNRETGEYLYEDDGECKFSREKQGDNRLPSLPNGTTGISILLLKLIAAGTQFRIVRPSRICIWWKKTVHFACRITQTEIPIFLPIGLG